jgi:hypothetical protein
MRAHSVWRIGAFLPSRTVRRLRDWCGPATAIATASTLRPLVKAGKGGQAHPKGRLENFCSVLIIQSLHFAARDRIIAPRIEELLPRHVSITYHPRIGTLI